MNVPPDHSGQRLDRYLVGALNTISRSYISRLIHDGNIRVNNKLTSASYRVQTGDSIQVELPPNQPRVPQKLPILFENDQCIVINKPRGLLVHAKDNQNNEPTVQQLLADRVDPLTPRGGIVHRLDRDTTGVMVVAKTPQSHQQLKAQFQARRVSKMYRAVVDGQTKDETAIIKWPIARWPKNPALFRVDASGKPAETHMRVLNRAKNTTTVELQPKTGRTHQLRVHMAHYGHPIVGDRFYNPGFNDNQILMLHAHRISFTLGGETYDVEAPLPEEYS